MTFYFYIMQSKKERYIININAKKENQKEALMENMVVLIFHWAKKKKKHLRNRH